MRLYLASASPRRRALLRAAGYDAVPVEQHAPEVPREGESARAYVARLAREKALDARRRLAAGTPAGILLAADTEVALDGRVLGKPVDAEDATATLTALSGRTHEVWTGVRLLPTARSAGDGVGAEERTLVTFRRLEPAEIAAYVARGSVYDKAGSYGLQELPADWVRALEGLESNVVGLPVERLAAWLRRLEGARG